MIQLSALVDYLNDLLQPTQFKDYCPNGLQIEGKSPIKTLVTGVSANQALIDAAIDLDADALLVHHGFFWKNESQCLTGIKYRRIKSILLQNMSLLAYHLPLDIHPIYGNNIQLANVLDIKFTHTFEVEPGLSLGYVGELQNPMTADSFLKKVNDKLARSPLYIPGTKSNLLTIAWCTGAAQDYITMAIEQQVDAFLTGEVSERTVHIARENNIHFIAAGHHATERYGVKALGDHLSGKFQLQHHFIDIENPV